MLIGPIVVLASTAGLLAITSASAQTMALAGKFTVNPTGAANYTIPIAIPPGTAGMAPSLSLSYSSQSGNGIVGIGWALDGLPSIGRCPKTPAQDGARGGVNFDANDRFCLDGQRLVAISGSYGADNTEYRTEIESYSKIISHGTAGTGPAWFEVRTKSGQVMEFGNTADSRILAQGKPTARNWAVNKVSDTAGNYFTVSYTNDATNGQFYPSELNYTGNTAASVAPFNKVQFVYATRPDIVPQYQTGSLSQTTVRLSNVKTFAGSTQVADYRLSYEQGVATGRSQLASLMVCDGSNVCLPATTFTWQNGTIIPAVTTNVASQNGTLAGSKPNLGDFNGDGLADIMWDNGTGTRVLWSNTGAGSFSINTNFANQNGTLSGFVPIVADFNRDGKADVWWYHPTNLANTKWISSTSSGMFTVSAGATIPPSNFATTLGAVADLNADGRTDVIWITYQQGLSGTGSPAYITKVIAWLMNPGGSVTNSAILFGMGQTPTPPPLRMAMADFNGDGLTDFVFYFPGTNSLGTVYFGNGANAPTLVANAAMTSVVPHGIDLNGDGKSDILWNQIDSSGRSTGTRVVWLSKGDGGFVVINNPGGTNGTLAGFIPYAGDFNGDGQADVFWDQTNTSGVSTGTRVLWLSKGDGTFTVVSNPGGQNATLSGFVPLLADFNGDGKTDILWDSRSGTTGKTTGQRVLWLSDGVTADLITSVTTGLGTATTVSYKSLTDSSVYTKDNTAIDPIIDAQGAMQVVARVDTANGIGGTYSSAYTYAGAKADIDGRGFLGFRQTNAKDLQTNILQTTNFRQDFPFVGLAASSTRVLGAQTLSQTLSSYQFNNASGGTIVSPTGAPYKVSLTQSVASSQDLDGTALPALTTAYQYDAFGNATQVVASTPDGFSKTTSNTFSNDTARWLLGRLTRATVTSVAP